MVNEQRDTTTATYEAQPVIREHGNGITEEWLLDGKIVIFTIKNFSRASIDTWYKAVLAVARNFRGKRLCIIHDYSSRKPFAPGPVLRSRAEELSRINVDIQVFIAVVLSDSFISAIFQRLASRRNHNEVKFKMVSSREKAIEWLKTKAE